jgi:hypothetical protein
VFEQRFQSLLEKYPSAYEYLYGTIYSSRQSWARPFINRIFTAGMQSTQQVESINSVIHKAVVSSSNMFDVIEAIDIRMQKEALNKNFLAWKYKTIAYHQPFVVETFFSKINSVIQKYLMPHIIEEIHKQMCESVLYRCEKLEINDAFEFNEDQSVCIKINNIFWVRIS